MATQREKQLAIQILKERVEYAFGKKVVLKEARKPAAQEAVRDFLLKNPGVTRKEILQNLFGISPAAARENYGTSGAHTAENVLSRAQSSGLIKQDNSRPAKWYAVDKPLKVDQSKPEINSLESNSLSEYLGVEYKDYQHGKPQEAAVLLNKLTNTYISEVQKALSLAGEFLKPGMKSALTRTLKSKLEKI